MGIGRRLLFLKDRLFNNSVVLSNLFQAQSIAQGDAFSLTQALAPDNPVSGTTFADSQV